MVVHWLEVKNDQFHPNEGNEKQLGLEVSYLSVIGVLMYVVNYTEPSTTFFVNLLSRYSFIPTWRH